MVLDANGQLSSTIALRDAAAKNGSGRRIPMHPEISDALSAWRRVCAGSGMSSARNAAARMTP